MRGGDEPFDITPLRLGTKDLMCAIPLRIVFTPKARDDKQSEARHNTTMKTLDNGQWHGVDDPFS